MGYYQREVEKHVEEINKGEEVFVLDEGTMEANPAESLLQPGGFHFEPGEAVKRGNE